MKIDCTYTSLLQIWLMFVSLFTSAMCRRDLSEIQYTFTPCGATGRLGPSFSDCRDHYAATNSPIFRDEVLFEFENGDFRGAQGFRVPKDGLYNITAVGAAGGRGICNFVLGGVGVGRTVQVELKTDFELLIMVGQKGIEPCSLIPTSDPVYEEICSSPPAYAENSIMCNSTWYNLTRDYDREFYRVFGGAGGGGASMVRARNRTSGTIDDFPIVIAGGGSGTPAILDFDVVEEIDAVIEGVNTFFGDPNAISYTTYISGSGVSAMIADDGLLVTPGIGGNRISSDSTIAGAGGGYSNNIFMTAIPADGRSFHSSQNFAEGGIDCARIQALLQTGSDILFRGSFGGFGGGGGACGGGGGGGGYTGGDVRGVGNTVPASGGFSYTGDDFGTSFNVAVISEDFSLKNRTDGYVTIVPAVCGCVHECTVFEEDAQFECSCPNDTLLAPDLSDCYYESELQFEETTDQIESGSPAILSEESVAYLYSVLRFENNSYIFSIDAKLDTASQEENGLCVILFVNPNAEIVLASEVVRAPGRVTRLSLVNNGTLTGTDTDFLTSSVLVNHAIVIGDVRCTVEGFRVNVSIQESDSNIDPLQFRLPTLNQALEIVLNILPDATDAFSESVPLSVSEIVGIAIGGASGIVVFLSVLLLLVLGTYCRKKRKSNPYSKTEFQPHAAVNEVTDSFVFNAAYSKFVTQAETNEDSDININHQSDSMRRKTCISNFYEEIGFESIQNAERSQSFVPRYGINVPEVDFHEYNKKRCHYTANSKWHYPRSNLIYMRELGEGQFGKVLLMKAKNIAGFEGKIPVAVKTLTSRDPEVIDKFKEEAELMKMFSHPNIVSLLGYIPQEEGEDSAPLIILEYMPYGDLLAFLKSHSPNPDNSCALTEDYFYEFSLDIAKGLDYLSQKEYIHRDIAARNCLVGASLRIKISDFGLAKELRNKDYYKLGGAAVLPVKWMAPECLLYGVFTSASDVWSYGVLLWEIVTYGKAPLEELGVQDVVDAAHDGTLHHVRPSDCPDDLFSLMTECHHHDPDQRIHFSDIVKRLTIANERNHKRVFVVNADVESTVTISTHDTIM